MTSQTTIFDLTIFDLSPSSKPVRQIQYFYIAIARTIVSMVFCYLSNSAMYFYFHKFEFHKEINYKEHINLISI